MSLDLYFFKKDVDFDQIRRNIDDLTNKRRAIEEELERLEDDYEDVRLASRNASPTISTRWRRKSDYIKFYGIQRR